MWPLEGDRADDKPQYIKSNKRKTLLNINKRRSTINSKYANSVISIKTNDTNDSRRITLHGSLFSDRPSSSSSPSEFIFGYDQSFEPLGTIDVLPFEVVVSIFIYLDVDSLVRIQNGVCRRWQQVGEDEVLWKQGNCYCMHDIDLFSMSTSLSKGDIPTEEVTKSKEYGTFL